MIIYPCLELQEGRPFRREGDAYQEIASFLVDPVEAVLEFEEAGADWAHIVDLDGIRTGGPCQHGLIVDIALSVSLKLQVAGGFRDRSHLRRLFDGGVDRVVLDGAGPGGAALLSEALGEFGPERVALSVEGCPTLADLSDLHPGLKHVLVSSPVEALLTEGLPDLSIHLAGSASSLEELRALKAKGIAGAVVGSPLWDQRYRLEEALELARA